MKENASSASSSFLVLLSSSLAVCIPPHGGGVCYGFSRLLRAYATYPLKGRRFPLNSRWRCLCAASGRRRVIDAVRVGRLQRVETRP